MSVTGTIEKVTKTSRTYDASVVVLDGCAHLTVDGWYIAKITRDGRLQLCAGIPESSVLNIDPCTGKINLAQ